MNFSKKIALRYLWSRRSEAFVSIITVIAVLGIAIGVAVLNITMAIMTGFEHELREKIVGSTHIVVGRIGGRIHNWETAAEKIKEVSGVVSVSAYTHHQALLSLRGRSQGILIRGVQEGSAAAGELAKYVEGEKNLDKLFEKKDKVINPKQRSDAKLPGLLIGRQLANNLSLLRGEVVSILSPQVGSSPFGLVPRYKRFRVSDTYKSGLVLYEEGLAYTSLKASQNFFRMGNSVSGLEVKVDDAARVSRISDKILEKLGGVQARYIVNDWTKTNKNLFEAMKLEKRVYFIVLLLIIVMASFSIVTTLIMIVLEKRKDIAIMKTMGASSRSIAAIFCMQGTVIGVLGTVLGLLGGYFGAIGLREYGFPLPENVFPTSTVPVQIEFINFFLVAVSAFAISCLSTIYPAWRASRLRPSEVLRYE